MLKDVLTQKGLSNREAEVAELVTKGLSNKEVANQLFVTEKTVKFHLTNIYKKMNVKSRSQLIVWCMPHMAFQETETEAQAVQSAAINSQTPATIPAGNSTVASPVRLVGQPLSVQSGNPQPLNAGIRPLTGGAGNNGGNGGVGSGGTNNNGGSRF
ncbi:MAG: response regulator transcription factor [Bdellovibrionales bacterium]|nr:response regulator transcription factor [Bdellovibrionales bacterium]